MLILLGRGLWGSRLLLFGVDWEGGKRGGEIGCVYVLAGGGGKGWMKGG